MVFGQADLSGIVYFLPIISFLLVFVIVYAFLTKTKAVGEHWFMHTFISFLIATVFVSAISARNYILSIVPWFAILVVLLFLVLMFTGFIGDPAKGMQKGIAWVFIVLLALVFLISAVFVFQPYYSGSPLILLLKDSEIFGALLLLIVSAVASWVLVKGGMGKKAEDKK